ncbi:MarR family transcriptional regulator [Candidatus Sumerlaeota bacterium]|nr:MarR family transcriptional regulator [Candidatus Sumerlaeota bacterium]
MKLSEELGLRTEFHSLHHEALLSVYHTASRIKRRADDFLSAHGLTDVQFNLMLLIFYQAGNNGGLTQVELSRMMLVNRANITSLIDRMERAQLVKRTAMPGDRRCNVIQLTPRGRRLIAAAEGDYAREVTRIMGALKKPELRALIQGLERIRERLGD